MMASLREFASRLARLERDVRRMGTQPQLAHSSIEGGAIESYNDDGQLNVIIGTQPDGSAGAIPVSGPTPPAPSAPIVTPAEGRLTIRWDGTFVDAIAAPMDFSRVEVHVSTEAGFDAQSAETQMGSIESPRGGFVSVFLSPDTYYVALVARSLSGKASTASPEVAGIVTPIAPPATGWGVPADGPVPLVDYAPGTSPVTIDDSSAAHVAFPTALTLRNGRHFVSFRASAAHAFSSTAAARFKTSSNDGAAWSAVGTILDNLGDDNPGGLAQLHDGRVVALVVQRPTSTTSGWYNVSTRTSDEGATWDTPVTIDAGFGAMEYVSDAVVLPNGDVLGAVYGEDTAGGTDYAVVVASTDNGDSYTRRSIIAQSAGENWQEPKFVLTPWGELLCFLRYEAGTTYRIYVTRSMDSGHTWTSPAIILENAGGMPGPHLTRDGAIVLTYRDKSAAGDHCRWAISFDRANTFETRGNWLPSETRRYAYAGWLDLANGDLGLAYGVDTSSNTGAVYFLRFARYLADAAPVAIEDVTHAGNEGDIATVVGGILTTAPPAAGGGGSARWELVMTPGTSSPPIPVTTPDGADWIYTEV